MGPQRALPSNHICTVLCARTRTNAPGPCGYTLGWLPDGDCCRGWFHTGVCGCVRACARARRCVRFPHGVVSGAELLGHRWAPVQPPWTAEDRLAGPLRSFLPCGAGPSVPSSRQEPWLGLTHLLGEAGPGGWPCPARLALLRVPPATTGPGSASHGPPSASARPGPCCPHGLHLYPAHSRWTPTPSGPARITTHSRQATGSVLTLFCDQDSKRGPWWKGRVSCWCDGLGGGVLLSR